jgi:hypothetical protein
MKSKNFGELIDLAPDARSVRILIEICEAELEPLRVYCKSKNKDVRNLFSDERDRWEFLLTSAKLKLEKMLNATDV